MTRAARLDFDVASALAMGARSRQEDALAVAFPEGLNRGFAILSDGMGGHAAGDLASRTIVTEMFAGLTMGDPGTAPDAAAGLGAGETSGGAEAEAIPALLRATLARANARLGDCVQDRPDRRGMGGTVIAAVATGDRLHWISVGDSALYLFRDETLRRLNQDHSMAPQIDLMLARGMLSRDEASRHPQRNCLTSALMGTAIAEIDCPERPLDLRPGDTVILASDGLQFLPDPIIEALLLRARADASRDVARDLIGALATMDDPEQDNAAIVVIRVLAARPVARPAARTGAIRATSAAVLKAFRRAVASPLPVSQRR